MNNSPNYSRKSNLNKLTCLGVVGGDVTCIHRMIYQWTGHPMKSPYNEIIELKSINNIHTLIFIFNPSKTFSNPKRELIWLFPERGPSQTELLLLNNFININKFQNQKIHILLFMTDDIKEKESLSILESSTKMLYYNINPNYEINLETVWLLNNHQNNLKDWLTKFEKL